MIGNSSVIYYQPVEKSIESLDPRFVYVLDTGPKIFIWYGKMARNTLKSKARLMAEKINKNERKNKSEIINVSVYEESEEFWRFLNEIDSSSKNMINVSCNF